MVQRRKGFWLIAPDDGSADVFAHTRQSPAAATARWTRTRRSNSTSPRARRARRLRTSARSKYSGKSPGQPGRDAFPKTTTPLWRIPPEGRLCARARPPGAVQPTWTHGRRVTSGSASRSTSRVTGRDFAFAEGQEPQQVGDRVALRPAEVDVRHQPGDVADVQQDGGDRVRDNGPVDLQDPVPVPGDAADLERGLEVRGVVHHDFQEQRLVVQRQVADLDRGGRASPGRPRR